MSQYPFWWDYRSLKCNRLPQAGGVSHLFIYYWKAIWIIQYTGTLLIRYVQFNDLGIFSCITKVHQHKSLMWLRLPIKQNNKKVIISNCSPADYRGLWPLTHTRGQCGSWSFKHIIYLELSLCISWLKTAKNSKDWRIFS